MNQVALVVIDDGGITLKTPYLPAFVDDLKTSISWAERSWNSSTKTWHVHSLYRQLVIDMCRRYYGDVVIDDRSTPPPSVQAVEADIDPEEDWADILFEALPEHLHQKIYRLLAKGLHPDVAGDIKMMQVLTEAYARRQSS